MGWKGTIRSVGAAVRAAERDARRRQRELERRQKEYAKMLEREQAAYEVDVYENYVERLVSLHKEASNGVKWKSIEQAPEPAEPILTHDLEDIANHAWMNYEPGFWDRLLKKGEAKKNALLEEVRLARVEDERRYLTALHEYERLLKDWQDSKEFAQRVLAGEPKALMDAIREMNAFSEISEIGSQVEVRVDDGPIVEADVHVHGVYSDSNHLTVDPQT